MRKILLINFFFLFFVVINSQIFEIYDNIDSLDGTKLQIKIIDGESDEIPASPKEQISSIDDTELSDLDLDATVLFHRFVKKYGKKYLNEAERQKRFLIFHENLNKIRQFNADPKNSAEYGINHLTDRTLREITGLNKGTVILEDSQKLEFKGKISELPEHMDWRKCGAVTPAKDQEECGTCWAFSTTGVVEGAYFLKHRKLYNFSEQQLVDCDDTDGHCALGGWPEKALKKFKELGGIELEEDYPYISDDQKCKLDKTKFKAQIDTVYKIEPNELAIQEAVVNQGPVSITLNAFYLQGYAGGILVPPLNCSTEADHAVLIVGYGAERGIPYWIIKNSWSEQWGEKGFFKFYRGANACGVANTPVIATVL